MASHKELRTTSNLKKQDTTAEKKKHTQTCIAENCIVGRLVAWGGAFAFACFLVASTFKRRKKIIRASKRSPDGGSSDDLETTSCNDKARQMEGLQLLLQPSTTDIINRSCHTRTEMLVKYSSVEDSHSDENRMPVRELTVEKKKDDEKMMVIIYEEEEWPDSENSVENEAPKYDDEKSSKVLAEDSSIRAFDEEENSSRGDFTEKIEGGDGKSIDIVIYIDDGYSFGDED